LLLPLLAGWAHCGRRRAARARCLLGVIGGCEGGAPMCGARTSYHSSYGVVHVVAAVWLVAARCLWCWCVSWGGVASWCHVLCLFLVRARRQEAAARSWLVGSSGGEDEALLRCLLLPLLAPDAATSREAGSGSSWLLRVVLVAGWLLVARWFLLAGGAPGWLPSCLLLILQPALFTGLLLARWPAGWAAAHLLCARGRSPARSG